MLKEIPIETSIDRVPVDHNFTSYVMNKGILADSPELTAERTHLLSDYLQSIYKGKEKENIRTLAQELAGITSSADKLSMISKGEIRFAAEFLIAQRVNDARLSQVYSEKDYANLSSTVSAIVHCYGGVCMGRCSLGDGLGPDLDSSGCIGENVVVALGASQESLRDKDVLNYFFPGLEFNKFKLPKMPKD
jgi:hypothetical protein